MPASESWLNVLKTYANEQTHLDLLSTFGQTSCLLRYEFGDVFSLITMGTLRNGQKVGIRTYTTASEITALTPILDPDPEIATLLERFRDTGSIQASALTAAEIDALANQT